MPCGWRVFTGRQAPIRCPPKGPSATVEPMIWRSMAIAAALVGLLGHGPAEAQDPAPAAWRVECTGDGKTLECRALQSLVNREDNKQLVALISVRTPSDTKTPVMMLQLPLGL